MLRWLLAFALVGITFVAAFDATLFLGVGGRVAPLIVPFAAVAVALPLIWIRLRLDEARRGSIARVASLRALARVTLDGSVLFLVASAAFDPDVPPPLIVPVAMALALLALDAWAIQRVVRELRGWGSAHARTRLRAVDAPRVIDFGVGDEQREQFLPPDDPYRGVPRLTEVHRGDPIRLLEILSFAAIWDLAGFAASLGALALLS